MCPGKQAETAHYVYASHTTSSSKNKSKKQQSALWEAHSAVKEKGTDPGIVFYKGDVIPEELTAFSKKTETTIVTLKEAMALIKKFGAEALGFNSCRGIIGSLAAIGETLNCDHTYELIAYRTPENLGTNQTCG